MGIFCLPARADLKIVRKTSFGKYTTVEADYYKAKLRRHETIEGGRPVGVVIADSNKREVALIDMTRRQYVAHPMVTYRGVTGSTFTVVIDQDTRDTGERRNLFGLDARHLITTEKQHWPDGQRADVTDGWYVDLPGEPAAQNQPRTMLYGGNQNSARPVFQVHHSGARLTGLPVWEKRGNATTEVTELSQAPLDQRLFEVPGGLRRVIRPIPGQQLSFSDRILFGIQQFQDWVSSLL
jgi:hypothetical protein